MSGHIVKITLEDTHPPVWRRVVLPDHISFYDLHWVIQTAFGWMDDHLHEFTFPQSDLRIGDPERNSWGDVLEEAEVDVDDFLLSHKWIRYTYDFGDDWRHKIVYEKEEPDYSVRYATVRKAKGDNFPEDCGGVWSQGEADMIPFDLTSVNGWLETEEFPVAETDPMIREMTERWSNPQALGKMIREAFGYFLEKAESEQLFPDAVREKLDQWESFYEKWKKQPKRDPVVSEESYEQMVLPGIELPEEPKGRGKKRYILEKRISSSTEEELLDILNEKQVGDFCKYLRISAEEMDEKQRIAAISAFLREHPKYYLYVLCREDVEYLRQVFTLSGGSVTPPLVEGTLNRALLLGLMDVSIEKDSNGERAVFSLAADLGEILEKLDESLCKETYQMLKRVSRNIFCYVLAYGMIDMDSLYERYTKDFGKEEKEKIDKEDFLRIVYWHCNINRFLMTMYRADGTCYAASMQLDVEQVMEQQMRYAEDLDYYPYSAKELAAVRDEGFGAVNPCWYELAAFVMGILQIKEDVSPMMEMCYLSVIHGDTVDEVMEEVEEWCGMGTIVESINSWRMSMKICLETALPMLKGYSRVSYGQKMHCNPYELDLFDEEALEDRVEADTPLYAMPAKVQQEVIEITSIVDPLLRIKRLERLTRELGVKNCDIQFMIAFFCMEAGKFNKADGILRKLMDDWPDDESVQTLYDTLTENIQQTADALEDEYGIRELFGSGEVPYRREERKVGRNEPCPCGSGKKYKHCCGKNK